MWRTCAKQFDLTVLVAFDPGIDMQINEFEQSVRLPLVTNLDLLRGAFMIKQFDPLADQIDRTLEEAFVNNDGAILVDPAIDRFTKIITEIRRR